MTNGNGNGMNHTTQTWGIGDCIELMRELPAASVDTVITSPPYHGLRDYGVSGQIGMEPTLEEYHNRLLEVTAEIKRVMKPTATLFWNHGDSYGGNQGRGAGKGNEHEQMVSQKNTATKCLTMQNERLIIRMIDEQGWILRNRIIWNKPNGMPSSVQDRFTNRYEPVYMLVKSKKYHFDLDSVRVPHKDATEVRYRMQLRKNKNYNVKAPYGSNTPYRHNSARITSQESPNRIFDDDSALERLISAGKNPGDVCELTKEEWLDYCECLWDIFATEPGDIMRITTQPFSGSHFAVFPTTLIEPLIKAACPAEICPKCGHIRERIIDREFVPQQDVSEDKGVRGAQDQKPMDPSNKWQGVPRGTTAHHTTGWTSCNCNAGWIAGTALDPFAGSGTVLEVCRLLNRNAIGIELNPDYEPMMRERSMAHTPPLEAYA